MKKGFTLIELLAVIVILAIIALIVTPVVSNIVANARIAANARSVEGHIRNVELAIISEAFAGETTGDLDSYDTLTSGTTVESRLSRPGNDIVTCGTYEIKHGTVLSASGCKDTEDKWGKTYKYTNRNGAEVESSSEESGNNNQDTTFNGTHVAPVAGDTHKGIVYMNPANLSGVCTSVTPDCLKFYIYDETETTYKMIVDRNLGDNIAYNSENSNESSSEAFNTALANVTSGWVGNPRLITANEIAHIVGADLSNTVKFASSKTYANPPSDIDNQASWFYFDGGRSTNKTIYTNGSMWSAATDGWQKQYANGTGTSSFAWLFDYTGNAYSGDCTINGCNTGNTSVGGYWTSSKIVGSTTNMYYVSYQGSLGSQAANISSYGIRPTLEVSKSLIG